MARRKSKARQQEEFYRALFGFAAFVSFFGTYFLTKSFQVALITGIVVIAVIIAILVIRHMEAVERLRKSGIADIDKMEGVQFEQYLGHLFKAHGYDVKVTRAAGDYGADLIITKDGKKTVVQAKRHSKNVGIKAVQEAHSAIAHYGAVDAWVVSNSGYTEASIELAKSNGVKLIGRHELVEMILKLNPGSAPSVKQIIQQLPVKELSCPRCNSNLVVRNGPKGEFYGCSSFPKCRYIKAKISEVSS